MKFKKENNILKGFFRYIILGFLISYFKVGDVSKMLWHEVFVAVYLNFSFNFMSGILFGLTWLSFALTYQFLNKKIKKNEK